MSESEESQTASATALRRRLVDVEVAEAERRVLQDDLRHSEERFAILETTTFDAILIHDKGVVLDCNLSFAEMFGYARSEVLGSDPLSYGTPESRPLIIANIASGYEEPYEVTGERKDGSIFAAELRGKAIPYGEGMALMVAIRDISERKEVERAHGRRLMLAHVHRTILEMERVEDFSKVVELFSRELRALGSEFDALGVNTIDEQAGVLISYTIYSGDKALMVHNPLGHPTNQELLKYWRRQEVWERVPDAAFEKATRDYGEAGYRPEVVIDAPFEQGTLALGLQGVLGDNDELIELLQACCPLLSLGYSRSRDLGLRRRAEEELEERVVERTGALEREIAERLVAEEALKVSLREKELLLKEIHHRVKNNMQVVSSLLDLQASQLDDPVVLDMFRDAQNRVRTMVLVHEKLYQTDNLARIDMADYIAELVTDLMDSYEREANSVDLTIDVEQVALDVDLAVPCGLILNELVSNAFKHGFPVGRKGEVRIVLKGDADGELVLKVADDGAGMSADLDLAKTKSLGLKLVQVLVVQIRGRLEVQREGGCAFVIHFPAIQG
ncbi:MAG TPA: PAS domain S-box protein [Candidatus Latescibacteria bacterium]|nr:PAS domain S-box protein [Candidatus Handelsmanbacteria bacterium]HIL11088.1 PAS domain S-box protein [Candidatus Latescibacterota bacterium]